MIINIMKKVVSIAILAVFLGALFTSLFHMSFGMDMAGGMMDCPFMEHGEVICPMNLADHVGAWKAAFVSVAPADESLLLAAGVVLFTASIPPFLIIRKWKLIPVHLNSLRTKAYAFSRRPLQELFSNGILHPKLF